VVEGLGKPKAGLTPLPHFILNAVLIDQYLANPVNLAKCRILDDFKFLSWINPGVICIPEI